MLTIAADPRHLGARIGITAVLHTWGSALTHHPHIHMVVPGGGISLDGSAGSPRVRPSSCRCACSPGCSAAVPDRLIASRAGRLQFFGEHAALADRAPSCATSRRCARSAGWSTPSRPSPDPKAVLAYLSRYTHRVAISNRRLVALDETGVTFRYKDYRRDGPGRQRVMTLDAGEFIRRFLLHVLPQRLPPHPPLRLARQRRPQNKCHACARTVGGCANARDGRVGRCARSTATMPMLWRSYDHHRNPGAQHST